MKCSQKLFHILFLIIFLSDLIWLEFFFPFLFVILVNRSKPVDDQSDCMNLHEYGLEEYWIKLNCESFLHCFMEIVSYIPRTDPCMNGWIQYMVDLFSFSLFIAFVLYVFSLFNIWVWSKRIPNLESWRSVSNSNLEIIWILLLT